MSQPTPSNNSNQPLAIAVAHLRERGHEILAEGLKKQPLDIVSQHDALLVFTTVRVLPNAHTRSNYVTERQRLDVRKAAARWLATNPQPLARELRFDAIALTFTESGRVVRLDHLESLY